MDEGTRAVPGHEDGPGAAGHRQSPLERSDLYVRHVLESLRVLIVAGILVGVVVAGIGGRLAMLLLRLTSSDQVVGVVSDDGFTIGELTVAGTYNLLMIGAVVGIIGAAAYQWIRPWLLGPSWFRRLTLAAGAGAVVGSMLIHADGVDFVALTPTWLAITLFIALPALFGAAIGPVVDRVERPSSWTARGRTRWVLPLVLVVLFPLTLLVAMVAAFILAIWLGLRPTPAGERVTHLRLVPWAMRAFWLIIATVGLAELLSDINDVAAIT